VKEESTEPPISHGRRVGRFDGVARGKAESATREEKAGLESLKRMYPEALEKIKHNNEKKKKGGKR